VVVDTAKAVLMEAQNRGSVFRVDDKASASRNEGYLPAHFLCALGLTAWVHETIIAPKMTDASALCVRVGFHLCVVALSWPMADSLHPSSFASQ